MKKISSAIPRFGFLRWACLFLFLAALAPALQAQAPSITSPTSASITVTGATLGGNVTSNGGSTVSERGVVYAITTANSNPLIGGTGVTKIPTTGTTGVFTVNVTGIPSSTGFSYKAYATNTQGTTYTSVATFTTFALPRGVPTISDVPNQTINEDTSTSALAITVGDFDTAATSLIMSGSSGNTTLVPNTNISFGGSGNARTVTVTPALNQNGTALITLSVSDGSTTTSDTFVLTVNSVNDAPSFALSTTSITVAGGSGPFTSAGVATSMSPGPANESAQTVSFTVTNNNSSLFTVSDQPAIAANGTLTFTPGINAGTATVSVTAVDSGGTANGGINTSATQTFTINITNSAPTNIALSSATIAENNAPNATVGTLSTTDPNPGNTFTYSFASGGVDNASFTLTGNTLKITPSADFETKNIYAIRVRSTDQGGLFVDKDFTITITNVNEAPTISNVVDQSTNEDTPTAALAFSIGDVESDAASLTMSGSSSNQTLVPNTSIVFSGSGANRTVTITPVANLSGTATITLTTSDGSLTATDTFLLTVNAVNDAPSFALSTTSITVAGGSGPFTSAGVATSISPGPANESAQTVTFTVTNNNSSLFTVSAQPAIAANGTLTFTPGIDAGTATVSVTAVDSGGTANGGINTSPTQIFTINITNSAPTNIVLSSATIAENNAPNATIGTLSTTDPNPGNTFTYSFASGGVDNASFTLTGNTLKITPSGDFETKSSYAIRIRSTDQGGLFVDKDFTITITNVNEAPTISNVADQSTNEDTPTAALAVTLGDADSGPSVLTFFATSSNTTLVPNGNFTYGGGTGANRTVTITPAANQSGTTTITLTVSDGNLSATDTFLLTVNPVNDPPSFTLPGGAVWTARDADRNWQCIASSADGTKLAAVVNNGFLYTSTDSGATWVQRNSTRFWLSVASSADGNKLAACVSTGQIFTSTDAGVNWTARATNRDWRSIASSADGTKLAAVVFGGQIYTSSDSGATWTPQAVNRNWRSITSSADGSKLAAVVQYGRIHTSSDFGATWTEQMASPSGRDWWSITTSADGTRIAAVALNDRIHISSDSGATWTPQMTDASRDWCGITMSADGTKLAAVAYNGQIYTSLDGGVAWTAREINRPWYAITSSADGSKLAAAASIGQIYTSTSNAYSISVATNSDPFSATAFAGSISPGPLNEAAQNVIFTVTNDNTSLFIAPPAIATDGTLTFTPGSTPGTAIVSVTAMDNGGTANGGINTSATQTFTITVTGVNSAPSFNFPAGATWTARETSRNWRAIASSADGSRLAAVVWEGQIHTSSDFGVTWTARDTNRPWRSIASSSDGSRLAAVEYGGQIHTSSDFGVTWTARDTSRSWLAIASSADGSRLAAVVYGGQIHTSSDFGVTWTAQGTSRYWWSIASSADGSKLAAGDGDGQIHTSTDFGVTWTARETSRYWYSIACSADGSKLAAVAYGGQIHTSTDFGATWTARETNRTWFSIASSADGSKLAAVAFGDQVHTSTDFGVTWTARQTNSNGFPVASIASSADGSRLAAGANIGQIYTSTNSDYNVTVAANSGPSITANAAIDISPGPPAESSQTVSFIVTNDNNPLFTVQPSIAPDGTLTFTPGGNGGVATVTVTAVDNGGTAFGGVDTSAPKTFTITINGLPTITDVPHQTINEDSFSSGLTLSFTVGDFETSAGSLGISGSSSNTALVPNTNLTFGGSGAARTLTLTQLPNMNGVTTITINVSDGLSATSDTFVLTVNAVNDAPRFGLVTHVPAGATWTQRETSRFWSSIASSADGTKLAAVVYNGHIHTSTDAGVTWVSRMTDLNRDWYYIASSADGSRLAAVAIGGQIHTSSDFGATWTARDTIRYWRSVAMSADGSKLAAVEYGGQIHTSSDYGVTWTARDTNRNWFSIASSADGSRLAAVEYPGQIHTSSDYGVTWTARETSRNWYSIASSADGSRLAAAPNGGQIHTSIDFGATWTPRETGRSWLSIASSDDGNRLAAVANGGQIHISSDHGVNWTARETYRTWSSIASSADGSKLAATEYNGQIHTSTSIDTDITVAPNSGPYSATAFAHDISPGPSDESAQTVSFTVSNDNNALFTVQPFIAPNGTLTFTPSSINGTATVSVTAADTGGTANGGLNTSPTQTFLIIVNNLTPIEIWRDLHFGNPANTGIGANTMDADFDGVDNLAEYAFGLLPNNGASLQTPMAVLSGGNLSFNYTQPAGVSGITYGAEWSINLTHWHPIPDTGTGNTHIFSVPVGTHTEMFLRHAITEP
jgi:hypothetical protein